MKEEMKVKLREVFGLKKDQASDEEIRERIKSSAAVSGTNMYILIFAILIACIGLNMNSTAIVIGAMLISPLMGFIISIAYGIADHNAEWVRRSVSRFLFQVGISIITSTIYFLLSPIRSFSGELAARTNPTFWDVLIALFGGFSAIIANTRKSMISNVIPGTAIATALMPPLCTMGYCLSSGKWIQAMGAGYLFLINTIFICLSAVIGLRIMNVTKKASYLNTKKSRIVFLCMILVAVIPSGYLAWQSVISVRTQEKVQSFISREFQFEDTQVIKSEYDINNKKIEITLIGSILSEEKIHKIESNLKKYDLDQYHLGIIQTHMDQGITKEELSSLLKDKTGNAPITDTSRELEELKLLMEIQGKEKALELSTIEELQILYPSIRSAGFSKIYDNGEETGEAVILMVSEKIPEEEEKYIGEWLENKFKKEFDLIQVVEE